MIVRGVETSVENQTYSTPSLAELRLDELTHLSFCRLQPPGGRARQRKWRTSRELEARLTSHRVWERSSSERSANTISIGPPLRFLESTFASVHGFEFAMLPRLRVHHTARLRYLCERNRVLCALNQSP